MGKSRSVTGASSGIGLRCAQVLHGAGAHVVLAARRVDLLASVCRELGEPSPAVPVRGGRSFAFARVGFGPTRNPQP